MSITNQFSSTTQDNCPVPLDLYYTNFLKSLSDIRDEGMRDRCHKHWTSLYRYFDRSITNERALILEEKRTHEILHRLDIEMVSRQSEITYQVRNILQRGQQVLSDVNLKYRTKKDNLKELEDDLENQIEEEKSEHSLISDLNTAPSSTSVEQMTDTIDHLKLKIKDLQIIRSTIETELSTKRGNCHSTQIKAYHIQQNLHQMAEEFLEIQHELRFNLQTIDEQSNQLTQLRLYKQNLSPSINIDPSLLNEQIDNEQKLLFELKEQNEELNEDLSSQIALLKTYKNKQSYLEITTKDLSKKSLLKQEKIEQEKKAQQELSRILIQRKNELKTRQKTLSIYHRQMNQLKNELIELEHKRDQQSAISTRKIPHQSTDSIKKTIHHQINHRLKLTIINHDLKHQINTLQQTTQEYALLVKDQRDKMINYEKLHDKWILHININRKRLLESVNRAHTITRYLINTNTFLEHFDHLKSSFKPHALIIYNQMNLFLQQRRDADTNVRITNEGKCSLNIKLNQLKKIVQSNRTIFDQMKQNLSLIHQDHSVLLHQISTIDKQRFHLVQHHDFLQNKSLVVQQQISNIVSQFHQFKHSIDLNQQKLQRCSLEKQTISNFLLQKQYLIVLISQHIQLNDKNLLKHRLTDHQLLQKVRQVRIEVLHEIQRNKSSERQHQIDLKHMIMSVRNELLEYRKKKNELQHHIHRRYITRQILTKIKNKSIGKENNERQCIHFQQKISSIISRLIGQTHYNIILHKRLDLVMENLLLLSSVDQQSLKDSSIFYLNSSMYSYYYLNNQLKSSIAELRVLKDEIFFYRQIYMNVRQALVDHRFLSDNTKKKKVSADDRRDKIRN